MLVAGNLYKIQNSVLICIMINCEPVSLKLVYDDLLFIIEHNEFGNFTITKAVIKNKIIRFTAFKDELYRSCQLMQQ